MPIEWKSVFAPKTAKDQLLLGLAVGFAGLVGLAMFVVCLAILGVIPTGNAADSAGSSGPYTPWEPPPRKKLQFFVTVDEGEFFYHDVFLVNTTGEHLTEVRLDMEVVGENASPTVERYWASWSLGETKSVRLSVDDVSNVQRIRLQGTAEQGDIDASFDT